MKKTLVLFLFLCINCICASAIERQTSFDAAWKFYRGSLANAESPDFDDSHWREIDLPHDWSMEPAPIKKDGITIGPFSKYNESGAGGADLGQTLGGEGWYRKTITLTEADNNRCVSLYFEGIYNQSEIYVNGKKLYFNPYGYTSFRVNIGEYCHPAGIPNTIAIRVVNAGENSRWYAGSGIYRHVWLIRTDKIHLDEWDTYIDASHPEKTSAPIRLSTKIHREDKAENNCQLNIRIIDPDGKTVYDATKTYSASTVDIVEDFSIKQPKRWSIEHPFLYTAILRLENETQIMDQIEIPFGIRSITFSAQEGCLLNGQPILLKGGCIHHDNGLLGVAAIDRAEEKKVELLKANGFNAVRCAHNQVSEHFLNTCDRLGLLVIHETFDQWQVAKRWNDYHQFFDAWSDRDLAASVRRDRNHPSIMMWSIGNEIAQRADAPEGQEIAKRLIHTIQQYDSSRYTTMGANDFWDRPKLKWDVDSYRAFNQIDVAGYNYMWWRYENDMKQYPQRIFYGSESYPKDAALNWNLVEKYPAITGDFVWTAIDYLGEAGLGHTLQLGKGERNPQFMTWPWYNAWCGDIDICGDKKPQSYYRDVIWRERSIAMAVHAPVPADKKEVVNGWGWTDEYQSWNWPGKEGENMRINVYSRSAKVRLYLNDSLIGEKETDPASYTATFYLPYQAGVLKAVSLKGKKEMESFVLKTAGKAAAIALSADRQVISANKNDLAYIHIQIQDADGNIIPNENTQIQISCQGAGSVIASGNASPNDMESFRSLRPRVFRGKALAIVQPNGEKGEILLKVTAEGLPESTIIIQTK